jgi:hypothetical protein
MTAASVIFAASLLLLVLARGLAKTSESPAVVRVAWIPSLVFVVWSFASVGVLLPWHYGEICDEYDAPIACRAATRTVINCEPGERCYNRFQKACSLGSITHCDWLIERGDLTKDAVCANLDARCRRHQRCAESTTDAPECERPNVPPLEDPDARICQKHEVFCGADGSW